MTNQKILEKAIKKAIDGGWKPETDYYPERQSWIFNIKPHLMFETSHDIIFNHEFAKALWGKGKPFLGNRYLQKKNDKQINKLWLSGWQYHLQQMVIADDPIKYLGENL